MFERPTRTYRSALREQQAERTRKLVAEAARAAFLERGWAGTSVRAVAQAAGVSQATVFNIYGSKAGLATSLVDSVDDAADLDRLFAEIAAADGDPAGQIRAVAGFDRRLFEHGGAVIRVMVEGGRQDPDLAAAYAEGRGRGDVGRRRLFGTWPAEVWREGVTLEHALDVWAVVCSVSSYDTAVTERGWTGDQVEQFWSDTLIGLLLA